MINYGDFSKDKDFTLNIRKLIAYCKENGENGIVFPKDTYKISGALAEERYLYISSLRSAVPIILPSLKNKTSMTIAF